ncbi:TetR/AcrR family transcriptional regulator [Streptomyces sp. NPDC050560]|uniref:TetR/AcrR family transcriptional regulator n=1 Tax=Streptomyces sp. NPDC050560 TaxID=3365630 RepID=UPI0037A598D4
MMPGARDSLLDAAYGALSRAPWPRIRMVDVAASAGVSRQTLYNEFGGKDGLARALVRRETDAYLAGADRMLTTPPPPPDGSRGAPAAAHERLTALAEWTVATGRANPIVRAVLTGLWPQRLPAPSLAAVASTSVMPAQRRADGSLPSPGEVLADVRERAVAALCGPKAGRVEAAEQARLCELAMRLALSCLLVPAAGEGAAGLVRDTLPALARR